MAAAAPRGGAVEAESDPGMVTPGLGSPELRAQQGAPLPSAAPGDIGNTLLRELGRMSAGDASQGAPAAAPRAAQGVGAEQPSPARQHVRLPDSKELCAAVLLSRLRNIATVMGINWDPLRDIPPLPQDADGAARIKHVQTIVARVNHFAKVNKHVLGADGQALEQFSGVVGLTSTAKDVTSAQLLDKPYLAVSGDQMTTAASVFFTVTENPELRQGGKVRGDRVWVHWRGDLIYEGEDLDMYKKKMSGLMREIRGPGNSNGFTNEDHVAVRIESATETVPCFVLNTIGFMPRAGAGADGIYTAINEMLNEQNKRAGGILVICHDIERPLDEAATWPELDAVKQFIADSDRDNSQRQCNYHIIVAATKGDLKEAVHFKQCHTFEEVYARYFGSFQQLLPGAEMFLCTGWRNADVDDAQDCDAKMRDTWEQVKARILRENPGETRSPYLHKLEQSIGTDRLKARYHELVSSRSFSTLQLARDVLDTSLATLQREIRAKWDLTQKLRQGSLGGVIPEICKDTEKLAMQIRLNALERPSSAAVAINTLVRETKKRRPATLYDEFCRIGGHRHLRVPEEIVRRHLTSMDLGARRMNAKPLHSLWQRMQRLKSNTQGIANFFNMPHVDADDINAFTRTSPVRNTSDVEHFVTLRVLHEVRQVFAEQLVPLLSTWIAHIVHDAPAMTFGIVLKSAAGQVLQDNREFSNLFRETLHRVYFKDVEEHLRHIALTRTPAFLERVTIERDLRETRHQEYKSRRLLKNYAQDLLGVDVMPGDDAAVQDRVKKFVKTFTGLCGSSGRKKQQMRDVAVEAESDHGGDAKSDSSEDGCAEEEGRHARYLAENPAPVLNPREYMRVDDDESRYLNLMAKFYFHTLLIKCISFFLTEAETSLDHLYSETRYEQDEHFLLKHLYFDVAKAAEKTQPDILRRHKEDLRAVDPNYRYQGYDLRQLLDSGLVRFEHRDPEEDAAAQADDPFRGIVERSMRLPQITYKLPSAMLPGYREHLHEQVELRAKEFLSAYFDDRAQQIETIRADAVELRDKLDEVTALSEALARAGPPPAP